MQSPISIAVAGATGLVGRACLKRLLADPAFRPVVAITRRPLPEALRAFDSSSRLEERVVDFSRLGEDLAPTSLDAVLCALGTTMKQAGSKERFREVDYEYPLRIAQIGLEAGARHYLLVTAMGANPRSFIFYNKVKGEVEQSLGALNFPSFTIARPSFLVGERSEMRWGEDLAQRLAFLFPPKYRPVEADDVAAVLVDAARKRRPGVEVIESNEIRRRAASL